MNRRGFVLVTVLWLVALLATFTAAGVWAARAVIASSENRLVLTRAEWARDACEELLRQPVQVDRGPEALDSVDLGENLWCSVVMEDARAKLSLNHANREELERLVGVDSLVEALLDWRDPDDVALPKGAESQWYRDAGMTLPRNGPLASVTELTLVKGWDTALVGRFAPLLTIASDGMLNANAAPEVLLRLLPGFGPEAVQAVLQHRRQGQTIRSADELLQLLSSPGRALLLENYRELTQRAAWEPGRLLATVTGHVGSRKPVASSWLRVVRSTTGTSILRREIE